MTESQILRPLSIVEMLDRAFRLYRNHFWALISIGAAALVPMTALKVLSQVVWGNTTIVNLVQSGFVLYLVQACLTVAISAIHLDRPLSVKESFRDGSSRFGPIWAAQFLQGLALGVPLLLFACALQAGPGGSVISIILLLLFIPYAAFLSTRWSVVIPGITQEGLKASDGLRRSWELTEGAFWRVLGVLFATGLLTYLVAGLPGLLLAYGLLALFPDQQIAPLTELVLTGLSLILTLPLSTGVTVLLYYDLRVRREGYDMALEAERLSTDPDQPE
jgi:hypothetical protein